MNLSDLFGDGAKLKNIYSRTTTKPVPVLHPEYGFCQQNGPERGHCYPNEQMALIQGCVGIVSFEISHHVFPKMTQNITR